jgi:hypothetical protein
MYYAQVLCASCRRVQHDLDVVLDVGGTMPVPDQCWNCDHEEFVVGLRYGTEDMAEHETMKSGPSYEGSLRE